MLFEVLRTQTWIFGQQRPSNSMNPRSSYCHIIRKLVKANFGILFPVFSLNTTLKSNAMRHFAANLHGNRATILRHHPREPCAPIKMATAGSSNSSWRPLLRGQKEKSKAREHFCVRKIYFWRLKEHFGRSFLKEWRFPLTIKLLTFLLKISKFSISVLLATSRSIQVGTAAE